MAKFGIEDMRLLYENDARFLKQFQKLIKNLVIVAILSIITVISFSIIKLNVDNKYNKETFGKFYEQYEKTNEKEKNTKK